MKKSITLVIPSLLPKAERLEWEKKYASKKRISSHTSPAPPAPSISSPLAHKEIVTTIQKTIAKQDLSKSASLKPLIKIGSDASLIWTNDYQDSLKLLEINESTGIFTQMPDSSGRNRELVVGIDFGTSSVKVVVGDIGATKAYAVPFIDSFGVNAYLLPSRLFENNGVFSLSEGAIVHRDLKLRFLSNSQSSYLQEILVGFFALIIRRLRAWLYATHADILTKRNILWRLVLGRATNYVKNDHVSHIMSNILSAAWVVAGSLGVIDKEKCSKQLKKQIAANDESVEILIIPELAAQIYGFVKSRQFDPKAKNIYLFVDIGAGTVDVTLFRVKQDEDGVWKHSLFNSIVKENGVMNLHRFRMNWWREHLKKYALHSENLLEKIDAIQAPTEQTLPIPEKYTQYFKGLEIIGQFSNPDEHFFHNRLVEQVRNQGIDQALSDSMIGVRDLEDFSLFLSGGGARLPLYKEIVTILSKHPKYKEIKGTLKELGIPSALDAPGLARIDYDRLSVAFGLSFIDMAEVVLAEPMTSIAPKAKDDEQSKYVSKDVC